MLLVERLVHQCLVYAILTPVENIILTERSPTVRLGANHYIFYFKFLGVTIQSTLHAGLQDNYSWKLLHNTFDMLAHFLFLIDSLRPHLFVQLSTMCFISDRHAKSLSSILIEPRMIEPRMTIVMKQQQLNNLYDLLKLSTKFVENEWVWFFCHTCDMTVPIVFIVFVKPK